jgi:hypothetical protein
MEADDPLSRAIRESHVPAPPEGLAERVAGRILSGRTGGVMADGRLRLQSPRWRAAVAALAGAAAGAALTALALLAGGSGDQPVVAGRRLAEARETVAVGKRAVAVLEPGAAIRWHTEPGGVLTVEQSAGEVFYRVESGPFAVVTPEGTVRVRGTCFRVEVADMKLTKDTLKGAALGAAVASAVVVTVYEGRVSLANRSGETELTAGDTGQSTPGQAPRAAAIARTPSGQAARLALAAASTASSSRVPQLAPAPEPATPARSDRPVVLDQLPAPVQAVLRQVAQGREVHKLRIKRGHHNGEPSFNVDFFIDGTNHELEVNDEGKVVASEIDIDPTDLPPAVAHSLRSNFPAAPLVDAELNQRPGEPSYYEVHLRKEGRLHEVNLTEDGQIKSERSDCPHGGR